MGAKGGRIFRPLRGEQVHNSRIERRAAHGRDGTGVGGRGGRQATEQTQRSRRCVALRHLMLSSSCHRIVLATAPGVPTPQHRFTDPQKLAAGFQLAFSRTGPETVSCSPPPSTVLAVNLIDCVYTRITGLPGIALVDLRSRSPRQ